MRITALLFLAAILPLAATPTTKLAAEWYVPFDSSAKQFALVDEATGVTRIAFMSSDGSLDWIHNIPTGLPLVSDTACALYGPKGEVLALTSATTNRVVLLDCQTDAPYPRLTPAMTGTGPSGVAAIGTAGARELTIAFAENGSNPGSLETRSNPGTTLALVAQSGHPTNRFRRLQPIAAPGSTSAIALYSESSGANTRCGLISRSGPSHTASLKATFTGNVEFAPSVRSLHFPTRPYVIGYRSNATTAQLIHFSTPLTTASTLTNSLVTFPFAIATIMPILGAEGNLTEGFIAIAQSGTAARTYRINAAGTGIEETGQNFTPEPGTFLSGIAVLDGIGMVKLSSSTASGTTSTFHAYQWDGGQWTLRSNGNLPGISRALSAPASLLFYNQDPAQNNSAKLLGVQSLPDWTRLPGYPNPLPTNVIREEFSSTTSGLTSSGTAPVSPPTGTSYIIANQAEPALSIAAIGGVEAAFSPQLLLTPPSGHYLQPFQVVANYDTERYQLRYRRDGGDWTAYSPTAAIAVAWDTTLQFTLASLHDGRQGPLHTRSYTLPLSEILNVDSDNDGVPDFVEWEKGLNPFAGADSDGDGSSDLDEILQDKLPNDPASVPASSLGIPTGGGIALAVLATDGDLRSIANNEEMTARAIDGTLIARAKVADLAPALPGGATRAALLRAVVSPPTIEIISIHSPTYFNNHTNGQRSGREIIGHLPADPAPTIAPSFTYTPGMTLSQAATEWRNSAVSAAAARPAAAGLSTMQPADTAVSVLLENLMHQAIATLRPPSDPAPALTTFTAFPSREADVARSAPTTADRAALLRAGYSHRLALTLALQARSSMAPLSNNYYAIHHISSATNPGMMLPLDALRLVLRGEAPPTGYIGSASTSQINAARTAYNAALAQAATIYRPHATWLVEISATPSPTGVYLRVNDSTQVALLHPSGDRFQLQQGLGLAPGTRFSVSGFIDTAPSTGLATMEVTAALITFQPASTDQDQDGNLLDDEWEKFFFGSKGQNPFATPHGGSHSLLQYFLSGTDPRTGTFPAEAALDLRPTAPAIQSNPGPGGFVIDFHFPASYQDRFDFVLERSTTLAPGSWQAVPGIPIAPVEDDQLRATIPPAEAPPGQAFYRITLRLKAS
jgi:hypothetical protein